MKNKWKKLSLAENKNNYNYLIKKFINKIDLVAIITLIYLIHKED